MRRYDAFTHGGPRARPVPGRRGAPADDTATTVRVRDGQTRHDRRAVRRDQGSARRLLPGRVPGPRRGDRAGREDPRRRARLDRGPARSGSYRLERVRSAAAEADRRRLVTEPGRSPHAVVDRLFREESGRAVATLIRVLGDFDLAEEAVQDAFVVALETLARATACPANPGAWITTTARNRAIDRLRRGRVAGREGASCSDARPRSRTTCGDRPGRRRGATT